MIGAHSKTRSERLSQLKRIKSATRCQNAPAGALLKSLVEKKGIKVWLARSSGRFTSGLTFCGCELLFLAKS
jgi:hypothetical protein